MNNWWLEKITILTEFEKLEKIYLEGDFITKCIIDTELQKHYGRDFNSLKDLMVRFHANHIEFKRYHLPFRIM